MQVWSQPFVRHMTWKLPVLVSLSLLLDFSAILDFMNYKYAKEQVSIEIVEGFFLLKIPATNIHK